MLSNYDLSRVFSNSSFPRGLTTSIIGQLRTYSLLYDYPGMDLLRTLDRPNSFRFTTWVSYNVSVLLPCSDPAMQPLCMDDPYGLHHSIELRVSFQPGWS